MHPTLLQLQLQVQLQVQVELQVSVAVSSSEYMSGIHLGGNINLPRIYVYRRKHPYSSEWWILIHVLLVALRLLWITLPRFYTRHPEHIMWVFLLLCGRTPLTLIQLQLQVQLELQVQLQPQVSVVCSLCSIAIAFTWIFSPGWLNARYPVKSSRRRSNAIFPNDLVNRSATCLCVSIYFNITDSFSTSSFNLNTRVSMWRPASPILDSLFATRMMGDSNLQRLCVHILSMNAFHVAVVTYLHGCVPTRLTPILLFQGTTFWSNSTTASLRCTLFLCAPHLWMCWVSRTPSLSRAEGVPQA